ncbi:large-conductance mechanosensitive channel protein MscL [Desulfobacca acetoxidans]|uniref:Large-conductance mechanosensitive channel n=1 Tax=Desulfobacca acetoxidans (strain ATCC 700848 / DSM 11109 / ASRB2) TaxID=880072 RepID=F2NEB5_DESAR|nr:large-conductance mechanosensitive channel protein MscL [Desulfobacca acetoxidans]AEB08105.1 Large-conductance mechanosensitive channel [Desulfobacca acetoxidans DSM 11109]
MFKDFREFAMRGNVVDMAVGIIIGAAFGIIVKSLVDDVIMPPIGILLGNVDFSNIFLVLKEGKVAGPYASVAAAKEAGAVTLNIGLFVNAVINFLIVAFAIFILVRGMNKLKKEKPVDPTTKECPYCFSTIPIQASRCPYCTSALTTSPE